MERVNVSSSRVTPPILPRRGAAPARRGAVRADGTTEPSAVTAMSSDVAGDRGDAGRDGARTVKTYIE